MLNRKSEKNHDGAVPAPAAANGSPRIKAIIFDIDGVLADSREAVVHNTKCLMQEFGFKVPAAEVEKMSTAHSAETVLVSLAPSLAGEPKLLKQMLRRLSLLTMENMPLVKPLPLAGEVKLLAKKYRLAAATNRKGSAGMVLRKLGIEKHFSAVMTSADAPPKPDPTMLLLALETLGVRKGEALFVGDNKEDELAASEAGVGFVLIDGRNARACEKLLENLLF
jgi:phosphoglycolate phosphatase-like HAD superfamily hydrolase